MIMNVPIIQKNNPKYLLECPRCGDSSTAKNYGVVEIPPISLQLSDSRRRLQREWKAQRCYCDKCRAMWDVVEINRIVTL